ncbi:MAG: hypothetical protein P8Y04_06685, partial [Desulfobulbaceae bacterium]
LPESEIFPNIVERMANSNHSFFYIVSKEQNKLLRHTQEENLILRQEIKGRFSFSEIIGNSNIFAVMGMPKASTTGISTIRLRTMVTPCVSIIVRGKISRG